MLAYFPTPYPDELLYSVFSRYYAKSGHLAYIYAAEELYVKKTTRPDVEFINELTENALESLTRVLSIEEVIQKHTLFPYYGRFLKYERRTKAFDALISMKGKYHDLLAVPTQRVKYLRYCPLCVKEDRNKHGETYWHRIHHLTGVNICPVHYCRLENSNITISSKQSPCLVTAEEEVDETGEVCVSENELERKLSRYVMNVFQLNVNMSCNVNVGTFLHSRLTNSQYVSVRGKKRNMEQLHTDFCKFYEELPGNTFTENWQLEKVFSGGRFNTYVICMIGMFLNISPEDFVKMKLPRKSQQQIFDDEVIRLHNSGLKYPEISRRLNASYDYVKVIGGRY